MKVIRKGFLEVSELIFQLHEISNARILKWKKNSVLEVQLVLRQTRNTEGTYPTFHQKNKFEMLTNIECNL